MCEVCYHKLDIKYNGKIKISKKLKLKGKRIFLKSNLKAYCQFKNIDDSGSTDELIEKCRKYNKNPEITKFEYAHCCADITELPDTLIDLRILFCGCDVINIPDTLINLRELYCGCGDLTSIPDTLVNLEKFYCQDSKITSIPDTLINLKDLYCPNSMISSIPDTLINLEEIFCECTYITSIPDTLVKLKVLCYLDTNITSIPDTIKLEREYQNKKEVRKAIIIQRLWKWKKISKTIPVCKDLREYVIKPRYILD